MKHFFTLLILFIGISMTYAQESSSKMDFRVGIGTSLLGSGDMKTLTLDNELNYKINKFFSTSLSFALAKSNNGVNISTSFAQVNANIFISPFKNNRKHDFRIGTGLTVYSVSDTYVSSYEFINGQFKFNYDFEQRKSWGGNAILEYTYSLSPRLLIGTRVFTQIYENGDINTGALLKFGIHIF